MGVVEDLRKLLQDVVSPDLKAIDTRLTAIEKRLDGRIDTLDQKLDFKFDALDKKLDVKHDALDKKIDLKHDLVMAEIRNLATMMAANFASITHSLDLDRRLERIESGMAQTTKERSLERTA